MRYRFIDENRARWDLSAMCRVLGVSRQDYYVWRKRGPSERVERQMRLLGLIRTVYKANRHAYGSPRITRELRKMGECVSYKTVEHLMRRIGLRAVGSRRFRPSTDSSQTTSPAPNLLAQRFQVAELDKVWVSDFTELPCRRGKAYAAAIMDLCSRRILGITVATTMQTQILLDTFKEACRARRKRLRSHTIFHSDQGSQFNAEIFRTELQRHGFQQSMSRKGNCYDNAPMESFWARMKTELGHPFLFEDVQQAADAIYNYVHIFYNRQRMHSAIGYMSPVKFEEQFFF